MTTAELQAFNQTMEAAASCKIGEKFYTSLTRAIMEIKDGDTITLLKDIEFGEYNDFQTDRNIVIDFAGHKFYGTYSTNADYFVYSSNGKGSITFKNGTIDHAGKYSIYSTDSGTTFYLDNIILTAGTTNYSNACYVGGTYTYTTVPAGFKYYGYYSDGKLYVTNGYWYSYTPEQFANVYGYTYTGNVENKDFYQMDGYTTYIYMQGDTTCRGLSISNYSFHKISDPENCYLFYAPAYPSYLDDMSIPDGYCFVENGDMTVSVVKAKYIVQYQSSDYNNYVWGSYNTETEANEQLEYFIKNYGPGTSYNSPLSEVVRAKYAVVSTDGINYNEWYFDNLSDANDWIANYTEEVIQYYNLRVIEWAIED